MLWISSRHGQGSAVLNLKQYHESLDGTLCMEFQKPVATCMVQILDDVFVMGVLF